MFSLFIYGENLTEDYFVINVKETSLNTRVDPGIHTSIYCKPKQWQIYEGGGQGASSILTMNRVQ